jgi:hypothetical protein
LGFLSGQRQFPAELQLGGLGYLRYTNLGNPESLGDLPVEIPGGAQSQDRPLPPVQPEPGARQIGDRLRERGKVEAILEVRRTVFTVSGGV